MLLPPSLVLRSVDTAVSICSMRPRSSFIAATNHSSQIQRTLSRSPNLWLVKLSATRALLPCLAGLGNLHKSHLNKLEQEMEA